MNEQAKHRRAIALTSLLLLILLLAACRNETAGTPTPTPTAEPTATATARSLPTATATSAPTPTPEPPAPAVQVRDQPLAETGDLTIDLAVVLAPAWVVVYTDDDGNPGSVLATAPLGTGENEEVTVTIDPYAATPLLHVLLHEDAGEPEIFEFPGPDSPLQPDGETVAAAFAIDYQFPLPELLVSDQEVAQDGRVVIARAVSPAAGWLAIHADADGEPGAILGQTPLQEGVQENVVVTFDWREATIRLHAVLYTDAGEAGRFEPPDPDRPVVFNNVVLRSPFQVTLPPDVFVINQPVVNDSLVVERVVVNGPAWLVVYTDNGGATNLIIGWQLLEPGVNDDVVVSIEGQAATPVLHLLLHEDAGASGEFNYPGPDQMIRYDGRLQVFSLRTDAGNYLITRDQEQGETNTVLVPLVVTDVPAWVAVQADVEGVAGPIIGQTWVPAGVNRAVLVELDLEQVTERLYVTLYLDAGEAQVFEYPAGPDVPLQRNRAPIQAPFTLLPAGETAAQPN